VPVSGDVSSTLTVTVTAFNANGNAAAVSAPTAPVTAAGAAVVWDPVRSKPELTLSNNNLTATSTLAGSVYQVALGNDGKTGGKWHIEYLPAGVLNVGTGFGFSNNGISLTDWIGRASLSLGLYNISGAGQVYVNSGATAVPNPPIVGSQVVFELDLDATPPVTRVAIGAGSYSSPIDISTLKAGGLIFPAWNGYDTGNIVTLKARASDFVRTPTAGYAPWDGG
jgi:hypothetical protein